MAGTLPVGQVSPYFDVVVVAGVVVVVFGTMPSTVLSSARRGFATPPLSRVSFAGGCAGGLEVLLAGRLADRVEVVGRGVQALDEQRLLRLDGRVGGRRRVVELVGDVAHLIGEVAERLLEVLVGLAARLVDRVADSKPDRPDLIADRRCTPALNSAWVGAVELPLSPQPDDGDCRDQNCEQRRKCAAHCSDGTGSRVTMRHGGMAERLNAPALKAGDGATRPRVRIPLPPSGGRVCERDPTPSVTDIRSLP